MYKKYKSGSKFKTIPPPEKSDAGKKETLKTLDRIISKAGLGSRTEARFWITVGRVKVNNKFIRDPDYWVKIESDKVTVDGKPVHVDQKVRIYIALNKPRGYLTTYKDPENRPTVYDLISGISEFLVPVGRLDLDTSGLLIMTNDTQFAEHVTNPLSKSPKTYLVKSSTLLTDEQLDQFRRGIELDDGPTAPAIVTRIRDSSKYTHFEVTITEGRNRQVRRMVEALGSKVLKLVRVSIGALQLEGIEMGKWRSLTREEVLQLKPRQTFQKI